MNKIIYTAIDLNGKEQTNFIEVESNKYAVEQLKSQGFTNILLHDNASFTVMKNKTLDNKPEWQLKRLAKFQLTVKKSDSNLLSLLKENIILNWWFILIGFIITAFGYFQNRNMTLISGLLLIILIPIISILKHRHVRRYRRITNYYSFGQWDKALKEIKIHRKLQQIPEHQHDLDFREASILAKTGKLDQGLELVSKWKKTFDQTNPGYYESRLSGVFDSADDEKMCLKLNKDCYDKSKETIFSSIDFAMTEAKYGDYENSLELISDINIEELPVIAHAYLNWIHGIVAKQKHQYNEAKNLLGKALGKLLERRGEILSEPSIAICSGELAVVLNKLGETKVANQLIANVSVVLKAHGYKSLLKEISEFTDF